MVLDNFPPLAAACSGSCRQRLSVSGAVAQLRRCALAAIGLSGLALPIAGYAGEIEVVAQAASDWMYHGTSESGGNPAAGLAIDWQISARSFVGVEAHQAQVDDAFQRHRSVAIYAGTGIALNESWYLSTSVLHREFPKSVKEWDFTELQLQIDHASGFGLTLDFSPDYYEHDTRSFAGELRYQRDINPTWYAYASIGALELSAARFTDYRFAQIGGGRRLGQLVIDVAYRANSEGNASEFGLAPYSEPKLVAQLSWRLR